MRTAGVPGWLPLGRPNVPSATLSRAVMASSANAVRGSICFLRACLLFLSCSHASAAPGSLFQLHNDST